MHNLEIFWRDKLLRLENYDLVLGIIILECFSYIRAKTRRIFIQGIYIVTQCHILICKPYVDRSCGSHLTSHEIFLRSLSMIMLIILLYTYSVTRLLTNGFTVLSIFIQYFSMYNYYHSTWCHVRHHLWCHVMSLG